MTRVRQLALVAATAVVEVADVVAVELRFVEPLVDQVMHGACPAGGVVARADLGRVLLQEPLEVPRAVAARVEARKQLHVGLERQRVVFGRLFRESCHHRVQQLPRSAAQFRPVAKSSG